MNAVVTVRYFEEDGRLWAESGSGWFGQADTLPELRGLAREGIEELHGCRYRSRCFFEFTDSTVKVTPRASEEFYPLVAREEGIIE